MKQKFIIAIGCLTLCLLSVTNLVFGSHSNHLSDLSLSSVEALADDSETDGDRGNQYFWGLHVCQHTHSDISYYESCDAWPFQRGDHCTAPGERTHTC